MPSYDRDATIFLGLSQINGVGFKTLLELGGVAEAAHKFSRGDLEPLLKGLISSHPNSDFEMILLDLGEQVVSRLIDANVHLIRNGEVNFPIQLSDLPTNSQPRWIFCKGNLELLSAASIAVVGTRSPTFAGDFLTKFAVSTLAENRVPVVSGLAKGIDSIAHDWALVCDVPTISVLGTGILRPYPSANTQLADDIVHAGGLLVSEYMPFTEPSGPNFVLRNRLQAAISKGLIAPEWKRSSGTAHTVRFAKSLGRTTINLSIEGMDLPPGHGESDHTFIVPREHEAFRSLIGKALDADRVIKAPQTDLFGGSP